jgi:hypothetical protein
MKMKSILSVLFLAIYSIAMAHSVIPHHHHSDFAFDTHDCDHNLHQEHVEQSNTTCCIDLGNEHQSHSICSFNEKTILAKSVSLSDLYLPSVEIESFGLDKKNLMGSDYTLPIHVISPRCRDLQFRGPPHPFIKI